MDAGGIGLEQAIVVARAVHALAQRVGGQPLPVCGVVLAQQGLARVDLLCPGFVADCVETLEEIAIECRDIFLAAGGKDFHYIPCLNDDPDWIAALGTISAQHLAGWLPAPPKNKPSTP